MNPDEHLSILRRISQWILFITLGISVVSLLGWFFGFLIVASINPHYVPMAPSSALCFFILSISLLDYVFRPGDRTRRIVAVVGPILTFLISLMILIGFLLGTASDVELICFQPLITMGNIPTGHMSPITAIVFLIASAGALFLVFSYEGRQRFKNFAAFLATAVVSIGFIIVLGYLYGTPLLYGGNIIPVALTSAIAFELIGLGIITASGTGVPPVRVFTGLTVSNRLMRAFLPAIIVFVLLDGLLYNTAFRGGVNPALISSLITILSMIVVGIIISKISKTIGGEIDRAHAERNRAEELLKMDEDRLETLLKLAQMKAESEKELAAFALAEVVRLTKSRGGYLHFFNEDQQTIKLYLWSDDVLKSCAATPGVHYPLDKAGVWGDSIRFRKPVIHNDYQMLSDKKGYPEGHFHLVRHLGVPIFDGDRIVGVAGVGNKEEPYDESDIRQISLFMNNMWAILKHQRSELERERLNRELDAFSYSVSHDLRAPLRHMSAFVGLLQKRLEKHQDADTQHYMAVIAGSSKKMGMLIDDLLAFSRMGRTDLRLRKVNFHTLVEEVVSEIQDEVKDRDITWKMGELPYVYGDQSLLRLALVNLIHNAVKYTRPKPQAEIEIGCKEEGDEFIFFVKDNGAGFDMKYADKLFGVFQRLHPQNEFEGTGIGLANVLRIISRHGGRTWAEGSVGLGATFYFTLPKTDKP